MAKNVKYCLHIQVENMWATGYSFLPTKMMKTKLPDNMKGSVNVEQSKHLHTAGGYVYEISMYLENKVALCKAILF